ncbi:MAG TPA: bifunctional UDP-N-acetylglucosamine diphosphorylase/glucosamine-1-phosphate N-acetyltransferase GlmU [Terriglobales bacterium]|nr:bifunctional UDP-N-acetylglucosamine diphosphorylase/glucosamine-1-phosphate N-acetyltransferase GlmU [Terriglobales bacterium]
MKKTALLVLAAGRGTRMRSELPKVLHQAGGRTMLASVLAAARAAGFEPGAIGVVAGYGADAIRAAVAPLGVAVTLQEPQLGTGHAVMAAQPWWRAYERLIVVHGDMPLLSAATVRGLAAALGGDVAAVLATASPVEPRAYGRIIREGNDVVAIVEERQATPAQLALRELNAGFYGFQTAALAPALAALGTANPHGEYYLTDTIAILARQGKRVTAFALADADECLGVNDRAELARLDQSLRRRKAESLLQSGVTIQLPDTVVIDPEVEVGPESVIEAGVQLLGATRLGRGCQVRAYSVLTDCEIGDQVLIRQHCVMERARVAAGALLGPFTRLREGADIGAGAHIGNFVEVKKTQVGAGSKANHLAYLGDARIGSGANIGAGTITCNYDGVDKHPTTIGDGAFVGSNATLVAPIVIGPGAYIGAGSVITENVPEDALAVGRGRQANKAGWARRRKKRTPLD